MQSGLNAIAGSLGLLRSSHWSVHNLSSSPGKGNCHKGNRLLASIYSLRMGVGSLTDPIFKYGKLNTTEFQLELAPPKQPVKKSINEHTLNSKIMLSFP